jgi:hypothetical protein
MNQNLWGKISSQENPPLKRQILIVVVVREWSESGVLAVRWHGHKYGGV